MQTARKKKVPSGNWSKFLYIFWGIALTSKPKWDFCVKSKHWSYEDWCYFFRFCANVYRAVMMRRQWNRQYFKWIQSSLQRKKNLICRCLFTASKKKLPIRKFYALFACSNDKEIRPKSLRHHARAVRAE